MNHNFHIHGPYAITFAKGNSRDDKLHYSYFSLN